MKFSLKLGFLTKYNLLKKYGIKELRDGLTLEIIKDVYPWILKSRLSNATLGQDDFGLVWYNGVWERGIWEEGTWHNGTWMNGTWNDGIWLNGTWYDGVWKKGEWYYGIWEDGSWIDGNWWNGIWRGGSWIDGRWKNGYSINEFIKYKYNYENEVPIYFNDNNIMINTDEKTIEEWLDIVNFNVDYNGKDVDLISKEIKLAVTIINHSKKFSAERLY